MDRPDAVKLDEFFPDEPDRCERLIAALQLCSLYHADDLDILPEDDVIIVSQMTCSLRLRETTSFLSNSNKLTIMDSAVLYF